MKVKEPVKGEKWGIGHTCWHLKELLLTCCKAIAQKIQMLSVEEIRREFNIRNDYTKEEEEQVRRENEWCMDR